MHKSLGYFATWLPGDAMSLGDVGVMEGGRFRKFTTLKELGIPDAAGLSGSPQTLDYSSTSDTQVNPSAGANVAGVAKTEIKVKFSRTGAFLFQAAGVQGLDLANRAETAAGMLRALELQTWKPEWIVIDSLYEATSATIIVSEDDSSELVLAASANLPVTSFLADPELGLTVASTHGRIVHLLAASKLRPLYTCLRVKKGLFGSASVLPVRGVEARTGATQALVRPELRELLES